MNPYEDLAADAEELAGQIERMLEGVGLPRRLSDLDIRQADIARLSEMAAGQWTAQFNPRPVGPRDFLQIYHSAY
jgi:alcohol dehydrogenase